MLAKNDTGASCISRSQRLALLACVLFLAIFFRAYKLTVVPPGLHLDEAVNGGNALHALHTGDWRFFYPENGGREGLFINAQAIAVKFTGIHEPWVLRSVSAVFGSLTVVGIYLLGAELLGAEAALLGAFLAATGYWHVNFSRTGFRAITAPFWLTWAIFLLLKGFRRLSERVGGSTTSLIFVVGGLCYGLGFHSYIAYRISPLLIAVPLLFFARKAWAEGWFHEFVKQTGTYTAVATAAAVPLLLYFYQHPDSFAGRMNALSVFAISKDHPWREIAINTYRVAGMFLAHGDNNWRHNYAGQPELFPTVALLFVIGCGAAVAGFWGILRRDRPKSHEWFLFVWLALGLLPMIISDEGIPHALRSLIATPAVYLLAAAGGIQAFRYLRNWIPMTWATALALLWLLPVPIHTYWAYFVMWPENKQTLEDFNARATDLAYQVKAAMGVPGPPIYIVVRWDAVQVDGIPRTAQPIMFITDTSEPSRREQGRVFYITVGEEDKIPAGARVFRSQ